MKKLITICLLFTNYFLSTAQERPIQEANLKKFRLGLKAAPTVNWLKNDDKYSTFGGINTRFQYGLVFDYRFYENFWIGTGIDISYLGSSHVYKQGRVFGSPELFDKDPTGSSINISKTKLKLQYLELPITLKMKTRQVGDFTYFAQFGFNQGFRLAAKGVYQGEGNTSDKIDMKSDVDFLRIAMNIGGGFEYDLTGDGTALLVAINYNNGFTSIYSKGAANLKEKDPATGVFNPISGLKARTNFVSLSIGFLF